MSNNSRKKGPSVRIQRLLVIAVFLLALPIGGATDPTYTAVRTMRPDGRSIALSNFAFDRDVFHITLNGSLHLLAPVDGTTLGAVFVGQGEYTLTPATLDEQHELAIDSGDDKLTVLKDTFESAVFFDTDLVKQAGEAKPGSINPDATRTFDDFLKRERKDFTTNFHIRVLQELLDPQERRLFFAFLRGKKYPPAVLAVDPRGADALRLFDIGDEGEGSVLSVIDSMKGGVWYLAHLKKEYDAGNASVLPHIADAERYQVDTTIAPNGEISGTTVMTFTCKLPGRVLPLSLAPKLRLDEMMDPRKQNVDEDFIAMMKDFASTYAGKNPSTDDFQRIVEKHAPPKLKLTKDGKLDWFFGQWVRGTAIPRYVTKLDAQPASGGKYRISGTITQSEVTDNFAVMVPIYVTYDKGGLSKLGDILLVGNSTKNIDVEVPLSKQPKSVVINAMHDVLAR